MRSRRRSPIAILALLVFWLGAIVPSVDRGATGAWSIAQQDAHAAAIVAAPSAGTTAFHAPATRRLSPSSWSVGPFVASLSTVVLGSSSRASLPTEAVGKRAPAPSGFTYDATAPPTLVL